ncbi:unnamed protein product [Caenorhabditis sp. 36 PRJEB53466]|nr:unnamed protein product [Caenorhabditis sp. 36 PRJEB53466]
MMNNADPAPAQPESVQIVEISMDPQERVPTVPVAEHAPIYPIWNPFFGYRFVAQQVPDIVRLEMRVQALEQQNRELNAEIGAIIGNLQNIRQKMMRMKAWRQRRASRDIFVKKSGWRD